MTPIQQMLLGAGGAPDPVYVDNVFSTYLYTGNDSDLTINNGLDLSGEGGLTWIKNRSIEKGHAWVDTVRGPGLRLSSSGNMANGSYTAGSENLSTFTSTGFTLKADDGDDFFNDSGDEYASWSFRKAPGFFDVVSWSGDGNAGRQISHSLGCVPGAIFVKRTNVSENWLCYHRGMGNEKYIHLNLDNGMGDNTYFNDTDPTSTYFTVNGAQQINGAGYTYIAYVFGGGEKSSSLYGARSVDFDGVGDSLVSNTSTNYVIGTNDFTLEFWVKFKDNFNGIQVVFDQNKSSNNATTPFRMMGQSQEMRFEVAGSTHIGKKITSGAWNHIAVVRSSGTTTMYVNGTSAGTYSDSNNYDSNQITLGGSGQNTATENLSAYVSNLRLVVGTAVYTSSFRAPTSAALFINNTKFLACQGTTVSATTVGTISTTNGDPTASTHNPYPDGDGFVFGENEDQDIIKCGSYTGNGSSTGPEIDLGWEPQWWLVKRTDTTGNWQLLDSMRGWLSGAYDRYFSPNNGSADGSYPFGHPTATGFVLDNAHGAQNASDGTYIYIAIRRPDAYAGKPAEAGTDVFTTVASPNNTNEPLFVSNFIVDFALMKNIASATDWYTGARLTGDEFLKTNSTDSKGNMGATYQTFDMNNGWWNGGAATQNNHNSWMWKRHAGFDVVTFTGDEVAGRQIPHSLGKVPEMMWVKKRNDNGVWNVYHKGLNGGSSPEGYYIELDNNQAEDTSTTRWNSTAPTSTHFTLGNSTLINADNVKIIAMLFASVDSISKLGYYDGSNSSQTITTGFQPRLLLVKRVNDTQSWTLVDTVRGWAQSTNDPRLEMDATVAQITNTDFGYPTSTGFVLEGGTGKMNESGGKYIYYAHA